MTSNNISTKSIARIATIQVMYQYKFEENQNVDIIMQKIAQFYKDEQVINNSKISTNKSIKVKPSIRHFELLVKTVLIKLPQIDELISKYLTPEWEIANLPILSLALLRVAIGELQFFPDIPSKVVINEFTDIASEMLCDSEVGFVNSILDKITEEKVRESCLV
jgi:N utilization substance protein B